LHKFLWLKKLSQDRLKRNTIISRPAKTANILLSGI